MNVFAAAKTGGRPVSDAGLALGDRANDPSGSRFVRAGIAIPTPP